MKWDVVAQMFFASVVLAGMIYVGMIFYKAGKEEKYNKGPKS